MEVGEGMDFKERAWIEIDRAKLVRNFKRINEFLPNNTSCICIVKADGYGHGAVACAKILAENGADFFGVASIEEAVELRIAGIVGEIIILGHTLPRQLPDLFALDVIQTVGDVEYGYKLADYASKHNHVQRIHLKIDTGMHRLGIADKKDLTEISVLTQHPNIRLEGCFSHFSVADSFEDSDVEFTYLQEKRFANWLTRASEAGVDVGKTHIAASAAIVNYPEFVYDYVRPGVLLYGFNSGEMKHLIEVEQVISIKSRIGKIDILPKGETIGYGRTYSSDVNLVVATVPIGYGDGLHRSYRGDVIIKGIKCPIIGRISMDQITVDVSEVDEVKLFDEVTILGQDGNNSITMEEMANKTGTITNEIATHFTKRLHRIYN